MASAFEQIVDAIHERMREPSVRKGVYQRDLAKFDGKRRVVWVPRGGRIDAATTPGAREHHHELPSATRVTALSSKKLTVQAYIFAESFETLEQLHHKVLLAVYETLQRAAQPGAFDITTELDGVAGNALNGLGVLVQDFVFDMVVPKHVSRLAFISEQEHECEIDNDL